VDGLIVGFALYASVNHLFVHCRFAARLRRFIKDWIGITELNPRQWTGFTISKWWNMMPAGSTPNRKAMATLTLLISWEVE
jgi:hypothetical protein